MYRLWNQTADNLSAIQQPFRKPPPTLRQFFEPVIQEMDPEQGIEDQYKVWFSYIRLHILICAFEGLHGYRKQFTIGYQASLVTDTETNLIEALLPS